MNCILIKVLIVDDEKLTREILANHIPWQKFGEVVIKEADDGINGYNACIDFKPDIVISDIKMPRMNGIEMVEKILESYNFCKFIFLSGYSDKEFLKSAIKLKAVSYVEKPIDIEETTEAIQAAITEAEHQKHINGNLFPVLTKEITLSLIYQKVERASICTKLQNLGYDFPVEGTFFSAVVSINSAYEDQGILSLDLRNDFIKFIMPIFINYEKQMLVAIKDKDYIIMHFSCKSEDEIKHYLHLISTISEAFLNTESPKVYQFSMGIGTLAKGIENIYSSYETAVIALKRCFFKKINEVNYYKEQIDASYVFSENSLNTFTEYIKKQEVTKAIIEIKKMINEIKTHENTLPEYIKSKFLQIILNLLRIAEDRNELVLQNYCKISINGLTKAETLSIIEGIMVNLVNVFFEKLNQSDNQDVIASINNFILHNYSDMELSLNSIAEKLYLTINYLCFIYKKETGKTINQYITEVRIEKAKELLRTTDYKLYSIANKVGYQDGKYFSKVFLKVVGMKPSDYRERQRDEQ